MGKRIFSLLSSKGSGFTKIMQQRVISTIDRTKGKSDAIATFMAILELIRAHRISIDEDENMVLSEQRRR